MGFFFVYQATLLVSQSIFDNVYTVERVAEKGSAKGILSRAQENANIPLFSS